MAVLEINQAILSRISASGNQLFDFLVNQSSEYAPKGKFNNYINKLEASMNLIAVKLFQEEGIKLKILFDDECQKVSKLIVVERIWRKPNWEADNYGSSERVLLYLCVLFAVQAFEGECAPDVSADIFQCLSEEHVLLLENYLLKERRKAPKTFAH